MSGVVPFADTRDQLATLISSKNVALVIGAGASASSGAPLARDLVERLREHFNHANISASASLFDAGSAICDTPAYGRLELVRFVTALLDPLQPSQSYKQVPRVRWRALFTTNYDDLIEKAYQSSARVQTLQPVHLAYGPHTVARDNHVLLFYLMGSIKAPHHDEESPVLSWGDFLRTVQQRDPVLKLLCNILADGAHVIYVGYSFNDFLLDSVLDEAVRKVGNVNMPYGHAILTGWPHDRTQPYHKVLMRKVIPVDGTFEEFTELIREIADGGVTPAKSPTSPPTSPAAGRKLTVGKHALSLTENQAGVYSEVFEVPDDSLLATQTVSPEEESGLASSFLKGQTLGWLPFSRNWAIKRTAYQQVLSKVQEKCSRRDFKDNCVFLVHGPAGLGKTVMARQLAFDLFSQAHVPVLLAKPNWRTRPDLKLIDRFCDDLEAVLPEGESLPTLVLIVDEAELLDRTVPFRAASYLRAQNRAAAIVLFARTNEYYRPTKDVAQSQHLNLSDLVEQHVDERISPPEIGDLITRLHELGLWGAKRITDEKFWRSYVEKELGSSFFDTVYSLVEQSQKPLRERVWSEFENLSPLAKRAYVLIAATHQFGIPLKMEILMRSLDVGFAEFEREVIHGDAREVLFTEHMSTELNLYFRGRTRLISQLVFERALPEREAQLEVFKTIVGATNPNEMFGLDELDALRTLLVQVFGPSGFDSRFTAEQVAQLFDKACSAVEDDVLEHHYGLVERDAGRLVSARQHLEKALALSAVLPYDLATLRESPQNIENSLAQVTGALAVEAIKRGDRDSAGKLFDEAKQHFLNARRGAFPNAAAYDAHARMLRIRAQRLFKAGTSERALALSEALEVLSEGLDNVNDAFKPDLAELRAEILGELGLEAEAVSELEKRAQQGPPRDRARYEVLVAHVLVNRGQGEAKQKNVRRAFAHVVRACELDPQYFEGWKLRAQLFAKLYPKDLNELIELLEKARACAEGGENYWVLYQLGVTAFLLERYELSKKTFAQLRHVSRGHSRAAGVLEIAGEREGGDAFEFAGRVIRSEGKNALAIRSEQLAEFGEIWFNPRGQRYYTPRVADNVGFVIGFNYRGISAVDLKRI